jgi:hypothetical protein
MSMINVKNAVNCAVHYFEDIQDLIGNKIENLRLEEAELSNDRQTWLITLGFDVPIHRNSLLQGSTTYQREYKLFRVDAKTGEVEAMKIREV